MLSAEQAKAIGLTLATADFRPLADLLVLNGEIQLVADRQADVEHAHHWPNHCALRATR